MRGSLLRQALFQELAPRARETGTSILTWGSLGEGILSAKFDTTVSFGSDDRRSRYEDFKGEAFERNLRVANQVREVAERCEKTPAQVALR